MRAAINAQLEQLVRQERGRLLAALTRRLGSDQLELADDVTQDALLAALSVWPYQGVPEQPAAWLRRVAWNKAVDLLRRSEKQQSADGAAFDELLQETPEILEFPQDERLRLLVLCCHPSISRPDQVLLALRLVAGFSARESAQALLLSPAAVGQRLSRAKRVLSTQGTTVVQLPGRAALPALLEKLCAMIYLMFSVGFLPQSGEQVVADEVCLEALQLARTLSEEAELGGGGAAAALCALLAFQSSRLAARSVGALPVLLKDQDRSLWNRSLIQEGFYWLGRARDNGDESVGRYHLEAGIAGAIAATKTSEEIDWDQIVSLHQRLCRLVRSPVARVNYAVALTEAGDAKAADAMLADEGLAASLATHPPYFLARAHVARALGDPAAERLALTQAEALVTSTPTELWIQRLLSQTS